MESAKPNVFPDPKPATVCRSLPPLEYPNQKTVVLDLDSTLIHRVDATGPIRPENYDFVVNRVSKREERVTCILKRPYVDEFLQFLSDANFEIVVFTAAEEAYASSVLDKLDSKGLIRHRLYRDSCKKVEGRRVKYLSVLGRDLKKVVIVDDTPISYSLQPENGIPIRRFTFDLRDDELMKLIDYFRENCNELFFKKYIASKEKISGDFGLLNSQNLLRIKELDRVSHASSLFEQQCKLG